MIRIEKPKTAKKVAKTDTANVRLRKRSSGIIGSSALYSTPMKMARKTKPTANQVRTVGSTQPRAPGAEVDRGGPEHRGKRQRSRGHQDQELLHETDVRRGDGHADGAP